MNNFRRHILCNALIIAIGVGGAVSNAQAQEAADAKNFDVPAQPAASALNSFAEQADITLVFAQDLVAGITTRPLEGAYTTVDGLQAMLEGTGLTIQRINDSTISIGDGTVSGKAGRTAAKNGGETSTLDTITVTGTRIRGGTTPSPVITIGSERIQEEGFTDLGEVIRSIPQNFSGGQNPGSGAGNIAGGGDVQQNITGGSGLNLRGLGPDASLTLLNGRRMAYGGFSQSVDISAIPVEAVERLEIVPDGASAIYGSDAVGGVGNVVLKRDYEGVTVGARYGGATDGGLITRDYNVTAGTIWSSGGLLATYKYASTDPLYTDKRHYSEQLVDPSTLYPGSDLKSGLISAHQSLGDNIELRLDALRTKRDQLQYYNYNGNNSRGTPETTTSLVSPSIEFSLPKDWTVTVGGSWGKDKVHQYRVQTAIATGVSTIATDACYCNEVSSYEAGAEGPLFALPGGDARLAVGAGYRKNSFQQHNYSTGVDLYEGDESAKFAYAELNVPLIGADQNIVGVRRLALTGAVRAEDYDTFGKVTTPKLGLIYDPSADFTLKASWGKSFKAPTLFQRNYGQYAELDSISLFGVTGYPADATVLSSGGGNPDLEPERARTWTASLAFHPEALPGLDAEVTWFDIEYTDRVVQPVTNFVQVLSNPIYAPFVDYSPTDGKVAEIVASATTFYNFNIYDLDSVVAIVRAEYANVARQRIKGLDLSGAYRFDLGPGRLTLRGSANWLDSWQQTTRTQSAFDLAGTMFNPPKVTGRMGAVWNQSGFTASVFANYKGGVTNTRDDVKSASFTTFDATLRYATGERGGAWSGLEFALSADNLFDRAPPLYTVAAPLYVPPYDQTNYSAIGRFLSLSVSKHW